MWPHALLTLYRSLSRHRLYAVLNVMGLAVGIAVFLVLSLYVTFETSFERWIGDAPAISVLRTTWMMPGHAMQAVNYTMGGLLDEVQADYPQVVGTRIWNQSATVRQGAQFTSEQVEIVDPNFFKVFDLPLTAGDRAHLLQRPDDIVLTESRAKRYFGSANLLGQRISIAFLGKMRDYRIVGVLKEPPKSTDLTFDFVVPLTTALTLTEGRSWTHWGSASLATYLRFDSAKAPEALDANFDGFTDRHGRKDLGADAHKVMKIRTQPLLGVHLLDPKDSVVVATLGTVGLLTVLLAGVNYVNLATARAGLRAREVALRKVMGATAPRLIGQFMGESVATAALSAVIGLALCELALPAINAAGGLSLKITYWGNGSIIPLVLFVVLVVGLGAGVYPALVLARFQPATVLASAKTPGGGLMGARVREALVVFQFAIAIAFTIATAVIVSQGQYLRRADLGFKRDGLIVVSSFNDSEVTGAQRAAVFDLWRAMPGVANVTKADIGPGDDSSTNATNFKRPGVKGDGPSLNWVDTGAEFLSTYQARILAGRPLDKEHGLDDSTTAASAPAPSAPSAAQTPSSIPSSTPQTVEPRNILINASALSVLGFDSAQSAIGQTVLQSKEDNSFRPFKVVGVIDNIRFRSPRSPVPATVYFYRSDDFDNAVAGVRYASAEPRALLESMRGAWRKVAPSVPFRARTIEDNLQPYYKDDDERGRLFTLGAVLAVAIGCVGLYGMASFNTARRVKEIGIRKTLGASAPDILRLLIGQFLRPVLMANLIAWPLAYLAMRSWLTSFDQRIALSPLYFLAASLLTLAIAVGTVATQAFSVARAEPAKALRHE